MQIKKHIVPIFSQKQAIVMVSDNNYIQYLAVSLQSLLENASPQREYEVYIICSSDISNKNKNALQEMERNNFKIFLLPIDDLVDISSIELYTNLYWSVAIYYRVFIPEIFSKFDKVLYTDCDTVFLGDVAKLFDMPLNGKMAGVVLDSDIGRFMPKRIDFFCNCLNINPDLYFNSGLILFDISKFAGGEFIDTFFAKLNEVKNPEFPDQDILNSILYNKVSFLPQEWNFQYHSWSIFPRKNQKEKTAFVDEYCAARHKLQMIHYTSPDKPWKSPSYELCSYWWIYARHTPFYEEILFRNLLWVPMTEREKIYRDALYRHQLNINYWLVKLASVITWGKLRRKLLDKKRKLKDRVKGVRNFLHCHF